MTTRGWTQVVKRWGLQFKAYGGSKGADIDDLTIDKIWRQAKARGPMLIAYNLPDTDGEVAHTIVAYGVFIGFNRERVAEWLARPAVKARGEQLSRGFEACRIDHEATNAKFLGLAY